MTRFEYAPGIVDRFPSVVGGVIHATGLANGASPAELVQAFDAEQAAVLARIGATPLSELPSIAAWRRVFRAFGVDPTGYRSAAEALLRRLTKQGSIPSINTLVDLGNLVSIRYGLPVAVFDLGALTGGITVRFATGDERFTDLGSGDAEAPEPGEVIFVDDAGLVCARRWCWRQSAESASRADTTEILVTVEGHHDGAADEVARATEDLETLLRAHTMPDAMRSGMVDAGGRVFTHDSVLSWPTMRTITPLDLRRSLGRILDEASAGERFVIERDHRPMAMLVSVEDGHRLDEDAESRVARMDAALERLAQFGDRLRERYPDGPDAATAVRMDRDERDARDRGESS